MDLKDWGWGRIAIVTIAYWAVMAAVVATTLGVQVRAGGDLLGIGDDRTASLQSVEVTALVPLLLVVLGPPVALAIAVAVARARSRRG